MPALCEFAHVRQSQKPANKLNASFDLLRQVFLRLNILHILDSLHIACTLCIIAILTIIVTICMIAMIHRIFSIL